MPLSRPGGPAQLLVRGFHLIHVQVYREPLLCSRVDRKSIKVKNLSLNPHVAVTVYNYRDEAVVIRGKAQIIKDEGVFRKQTQAHIDKYNRLFNKVRGTKGVEYIKLDERGRDNMGIPLFDPKIRCVIEVTPTKILS